VDVIPELKKPVTASFIGQGEGDAENFLEQRGVPEFEFPERAAEAMAALCTRAEIVRRQQEVQP
jgi:acyl-CoA synthetase (NDP forming)